jgi:hypothetical protein
MDQPGQPTDPPRRPGGAAVSVLLGLAGLAWGVGTPVLWYAAGIAGASFFGEPPTPAEQQASARLFLWALACGLAVPFAGLVLSLATGRRAAAAVMAVALAIGLAAGVATGTLSGETARGVRDHLNPPEPTSERWPRHCQEHSGGANTCPGG